MNTTNSSESALSSTRLSFLPVWFSLLVGFAVWSILDLFNPDGNWFTINDSMNDALAILILTLVVLGSVFLIILPFLISKFLILKLTGVELSGWDIFGPVIISSLAACLVAGLGLSLLYIAGIDTHFSNFVDNILMNFICFPIGLMLGAWDLVYGQEVKAKRRAKKLAKKQARLA